MTLAEYKGVAIPEYRFHRGTFTKQIEPFLISGINAGTDVFTTTLNHPFANGDLVRFGVRIGGLPTELSTDLKYQISDKTDNSFKVKDEAGLGYINVSTEGIGELIVWKANAGWDDPEQGRPQYCPEFDSTFNNIAYVEGKLSAAHSHATNAPDWEQFRFAGDGRRLMDYSSDGTELGVILGTNETQRKQLSLVPLQIMDNFLVSYKGKKSRVDFPSWRTMRESAEQEIWQRIKTDETAETHGLTARYFQGDNFTLPVITRTDLQVNIPSTGPAVPPAPGVIGYGFSIIWTGKIKFEFSEVYTLSFVVDNSVEMIIDGVTVLSSTQLGVNSITKAFVADQVYNIEIRFRQLQVVGAGNLYQCQFQWQSASQSLEVVPSEWLFPSDEVVLRYGQIGIAFPTPTESSEVHERLMERMPGYDWTDDAGKIVYLPPTRPIAFPFKFDRPDDDSSANFVYGSFQKRRRPLADRRNFRLGRGRDTLKTGYPIFYVQVDRDEWRELANGEPSNDPAAELGVCTLSMAERMLEMEMIFKSDPTHSFSIAGVRGSSKLRKNYLITVVYIDLDGNHVADVTGIITSHSWGAKNSRNDFNALPVPVPFYSDEEV